MPKKIGDSGSQDKKSKKDDLHNKLIDNMVQLQLVQTKLAERLDKLSNQISDLLALFEKAARSFPDNPSIQHHSAEKDKAKDKEFIDKINTLLEQNKTIAKGLTLMEERVRENVQENESPEESQGQEQEENIPAAPRPLPKF